MLFLPLPLFIAEFLIFLFAIQEWGFLQVIAAYLAPCLLGFIILSLMGRWALFDMQRTLLQGQMPANSLLHSAAVFVAGVLLLVPTFFTRLIAVLLILPGSRHFAVSKLKTFFLARMGRGFSGFSFGAGKGFGGGFQYYDFRGPGAGGMGSEARSERTVSEVNVLDVKPLEIIHETKKGDETPS